MIKKENKGTSPESKVSKVASRSYTPISDALEQPNVLVDNEFSESFALFKVASTLKQCLHKDRRADGVGLSQIAMSLMIWPVLKLASVHCFCAELCQYLEDGGNKPKRSSEILYDFWGREDINWSQFSRKITHKVYKATAMDKGSKLCFVVDDTLKSRRGKKVEGSSLHHNHNSGKTEQGHQLLELGLVGDDGFLPLDRQLYMSDKNAILKPEAKGFKDKRSASARDMKRAEEENKNEMLRRMLKRAVSDGYEGRYLLGDSWFGNKQNIETTLDLGLHAIFQMKRGNLKYKVDGKLVTAQELYIKHQRKLKPTGENGLYKTFKIEAELNLESDPKKADRWQKIVLILSAPVRESSQNWVIFLSTDMSLTAEEVLVIYAKRWAIEVYFKEAKQSFGLLSEQSGKYQVAYASVHLAAVRYMLIYESMQRKGAISFGAQRDKITGQMQILTYAGLLWSLFQYLIVGALESITSLESSLKNSILEAINSSVETFLSQAIGRYHEPVENLSP